MKKSIVKRVLALAMALSVCSSMLVAPAEAAGTTVGSGETIILSASPQLAAWVTKNHNYLSNRALQDLFDNCLYLYFTLETIAPNYSMTMGTAAYNSGSITYVPMDILNQLATRVNQQRGFFEDLVCGAVVVENYYDTGEKGICFYFNPGSKYVTYHDPFTGETYYNESRYGPNGEPLGVQAFWLCDPETGNILLSNDGIKYDEPVENEKTEVSSSANIVGSWISDTEALKSKSYRMVGYEDLHNAAIDVRGYLSLRNGKYYIIDYMGENIYCGNDGLPYCAWPKTATVTETVRETDVIIDNTTIDKVTIEGGSNVQLDIDELIATLPDGSTVNADNIIYDDNSQTYYINTSQGSQSTNPDGTVTYNNTFNYAYTYNIDYTNVTYIGQTAEYTEVYDVYYKLPDGRSSSDLTAAELEQLNLQVDVLNYGRSADDVSLRSLYHFDGTIEDASYWNYCTGFQWNSGASLTYLDAGNFDGCLYLDEQEHDFTFTLPSNISSGDFTLQFRYYQSSTLAPQNDSYIKLGDYTLLRLDGKNILDGSGNVIRTVPIGTWNELALIRHSGTLYYYLNGVKIGSVSHSLGIGNTVQFHFGEGQQTYKYLDELRALNFALAESGASYTPTSVPHDTNLSLVLPTDHKPIADEYWNVTSSKKNLFGFTFEEFIAGAGQHLNASPANAYVAGAPFPKYFNVSGYGTISTGSQGILMSRTSSYSSVLTKNTTNSYYLTAPINIRLGYKNISGNGGERLGAWTNNITGKSVDYKDKAGYPTPNDTAASYVFSLVLSDGTVSSFPFSFSASGSTSKTTTYDWGQIALAPRKTNPNASITDYGQILSIIPNDTIEVLYMELCNGTETDLNAEYVSSVTEMTPDQLKGFTLAVRSTVEVTSYQIGGVRPSLPKKGMVWALVENSKISSLQIYDGRAWVEVDGRIWTGSRWAPLTAYDVMLQKDLADISGVTITPDYEYIYTDSGFWDWWQRSWNAFTEKFFNTQTQGGTSNESHVHTYVPETLTEATCTTAGQQKVTCTGCGDTKIEATKPLGHDFEEIADTASGHVEPTGLICSHCASTDISCELSGPVAICSCNDCLYVWEVQAEYEYGETLYKCRRCGEEKKDTKDDRGLFSLIGSFFADTIRWIVSKLGSLVAALAALAQLFADFIETVISFAGDHPAFFAAALALIPADLMTLIWFSIVSGIIMLVWKKFKG